MTLLGLPYSFVFFSALVSIAFGLAIYFAFVGWDE